MITRKMPVEVYSRVVGFFRPINQYNKGKREEQKQRYEYSQKEIEESLNYIEDDEDDECSCFELFDRCRCDNH
jgi:ribonucleoside-triphosphate reductase